MRKLLISLSLVSLSFFCQAQKIGYFNSTEVLKNDPLVKRADSAVNIYLESLKYQYEYLQAEYTEKSAKYAKEDTTSKNEVKRLLLKKDIDALFQTLNNYQNDATQRLTSKRNELYMPINKKLTDIVEGIAKENKYDAVFDIASTTIFYVNKSNDLTDIIKKKFK